MGKLTRNILREKYLSILLKELFLLSIGRGWINKNLKTINYKSLIK
jgi:hypothetical protein